jgi:hypothetical protein
MLPERALVGFRMDLRYAPCERFGTHNRLSILYVEPKRDQEGKQELSGRCFAWVQTYDEKPKRGHFELLKRQGMQPNQQVDFLSDGGEDVHNVPLYLNPQG